MKRRLLVYFPGMRMSFDLRDSQNATLSVPAASMKPVKLKIMGKSWNRLKSWLNGSWPEEVAAVKREIDKEYLDNPQRIDLQDTQARI